mmetsp:Transcript_28540/g.71735  ORF Transcript_28540/g.71735 Transcript_28540/m.71735 type:complete len:279 (-) Transcript_28540:87-923(-)
MFTNTFQNQLSIGALAVEDTCSLIHQTQIGELLHGATPAGVAVGTTDESLALGNVEDLTVRCAVAVRIALEGETFHNRVIHRVMGVVIEQSSTAHLDRLTVTVETCSVQTSQQNTTRSPAELVAERIVVVDRSRQTTTVAEEGDHLAAVGVGLIDDTLRTHVVGARVQATLVHEQHTSLAGAIGQRTHGIAHVAGGQEVLAVAQRHLGQQRMVHVGQHADAGIVVSHQLLETGQIVGRAHIQLHCSGGTGIGGALEAAQLLCLAESARGYCHRRLGMQ